MCVYVHIYIFKQELIKPERVHLPVQCLQLFLFTYCFSGNVANTTHVSTGNTGSFPVTLACTATAVFLAHPVI